MASYHLTVKAVSRGKGKSVIAKAAYNAREKLIDERTGEVKDYSRHGDKPVFSGLFIPRDAPEWAQDRESLWNAVEAREKRKDAVPAIELEVALPHELTDEQRRFLITDFVREQFQRKGYAADVQIHPPPREPENENDKPNHHAHILIGRRSIGPEGFTGNLMKHGPEELEHWRGKWAERGAKELRKAGFELEADRYAVGHLDIAKQRQAAIERGDHEHAEALNREATKHRGPTVDAMEREGVETDRGKEAREAARPKPKEIRIERIEGQLMAVMHDEKNRLSVHSLDHLRIALVSRQDVADHEILREAQAGKRSREAQHEAEQQSVNGVRLQQDGTIRMYRGIGKNVAPSEPGDTLFFSTNPARAAHYGELHYVDITPAELANFERPHTPRYMRAEPIAQNDWKTDAPAIIARLQPLVAERTKVREPTSEAPPLRAGELVAVMLDDKQQPTVWNFNYERGDNTDKYLASIDRPNAPSVRKAGVELHELAAERDQWQDLSKKAGEIRLAYTLSATPEEFFQGMAERGGRIGRVTQRDIIQNAYEHEFLAEQGKAGTGPTLSEKIDQLDPRRVASLSLHEGDLVVINRFGSVSLLNEHTTGDTRKEIQEFLGTLAENLPGICEIRETNVQAIKGPIIDADARQSHEVWQERIAELQREGAGSSAARDRQAEGERPENWLERIKTAATLGEMRGLEREIVIMQRELREQLRDENLGIEHRAALLDVSSELRDLRRETRTELTALSLDTDGLVIENTRDLVREIASHSVDAAFSDIAQTTETAITFAGEAKDAAVTFGHEVAGVVAGAVEIATEAVEFVADFLFPDSKPTPELIQARKEAKEEKQAQAEIDWKRYYADDTYRAAMREQEREKREKEAERERLLKGRKERGIDYDPERER